MKSNTRKIVMAAMLAALVCVATMIIKIPSPLKGYINLGDCVVLLAGWMLSPVYGTMAAGVGSALADVFSGYALYAPATFVIKGAMALCAHFLGKRSKIASGIAAEVLMVAGYLIFEGVLYGFAPALLNVTANCVQGAAGLVLGLALAKLFAKANVTL